MKKSLKNKFKNSLNFLKTFPKKSLFWLKKHLAVISLALVMILMPVFSVNIVKHNNFVQNFSNNKEIVQSFEKKSYYSVEIKNYSSVLAESLVVKGLVKGKNFLKKSSPYLFSGAAAGVVAYNWGVDIMIAVTSMVKTVMNWILYAVGFIFDNMMYLSITPAIYNQEWILVVWGTVRELANIAFILGVIYIGFSMIFNLSNWKSKLINLIIIAFIVNFSWTIGRIIVDAGNFTAGIFYSMTSVRVDSDDPKYFTVNDGNRYIIADYINGNVAKEENNPYFGERSLAVGLVSFIDPTVLKGDKKWIERKLQQNGDSENFKKDIAWISLTLDIIYIIILFYFIGPLLQGAFMMITRIFYIIKYLAFAPAYFVWYFLPGGESALNKWFSEIAGKAFCLTGYTIGFWILFLFMNNMRGTADDLIETSSLIVIVAIVAFKTVLLKKGIEAINEYGTKSCDEGEPFGKSFVDKVTGITQGIAKFPTNLVGGGASMVTRGLAHRSINGFSNFLDKRAGKGGAIVSAVNSWASRKTDNLYNFKIGSKTIREDLEHHAEDEQADLRRIRKAQGEEAEKAYKLKRTYGVHDVNKIDKSLFDDGTVKKLDDISANEGAKKEEIKKELGFAGKLNGLDNDEIDSLVGQEYKAWKNKETIKIKQDFALNNYDKIRGTDAVKEGAWSSMMEVMTGVHGSMTALNKDYLAAQNRLKAEEARLKAEVGKASDVYNAKDTEESMKLKKRQLRLQEAENQALKKSASAQKTMVEILNGLADENDKYNGVDIKGIDELSEEEFNDFMKEHETQLGELTTIYDENKTDWKKKQEAYNDSSDSVNTAKSELTKLEKQLADAEAGDEVIIDEENLSGEAAVAAVKKAIINQKNAVSQSESELANAEREFKNILNSTMQVANEISSDMRKSAMNAAKDELERVQRTVSEKVGQVQREMKELAEAEGSGKVFTRGVDEKNT